MTMRALALAAALIAPAAAQAQTHAMATLPPGTILNTQTTIIAKVVQDRSALKMRVVPFGGDAAAFDAVNGGQAEFNLIDVGEGTAALTGTDHFAGKPRANLRAAIRMNFIPLAIFVRKDSPARRIADLKGLRYPVSWDAHPAMRAISALLLASDGLAEKDINPLPAVNLIRAADDFKAGRIDAVPFAVGAPKVAEVGAGVGGVRFLAVPDSAEALARMRRLRPDYFTVELRPAPHLPGIEAPTRVAAVDVIVAVGTHVKDETVYDFVRALHKNKADLVAGHPSFNAFDPAQAAKSFTAFKYHPGAIKYFREAGLWKE